MDLKQILVIKGSLLKGRIKQCPQATPTSIVPQATTTFMPQATTAQASSLPHPQQSTTSNLLQGRKLPL